MKAFCALLIVVLVLSYDSVLFVIHLPVIHQWLKLGSYLLLLALVLGNLPQSRQTNHMAVLFRVFLALIIYLSIPALLAGSGSLVVWFKTIIRISTLFLFWYALSRYGIDSVCRLCRWVGVLLAIQSIVFYTLLITNNAPEPNLLTRFDDTDIFISYGIFGFGNWIFGNEAVGFITFRVQSFFSEATRFAMFQILPLSLLLIEGKRNRMHLIGALLVGVSIVLTFSFSASVGLIVGLVFYFGMRRFIHLGTWGRVVPLLMVCATLGYGYFAFSRGVFEETGRGSNPLLGAIARSDGSVAARLSWTNAVFAEVAQRPWGNGFTMSDEFAESHGKLPMAPVQWFYTGGLIGGMLMLWIQLLLWRKYYLPGLTSTNPAERLIAMCCVALMITSIVHGNWTDPFYFLPIALLVTIQQGRAAIPGSGCAGGDPSRLTMRNPRRHSVPLTTRR